MIPLSTNPAVAGNKTEHSLCKPKIAVHPHMMGNSKTIQK